MLLCMEVVQVESLDLVTEPQLPQLQAEPPGARGQVNLDLLQDIEQVGGDGEQDRVQRNLPILLTKFNFQYNSITAITIIKLISCTSPPI